MNIQKQKYRIANTPNGPIAFPDGPLPEPEHPQPVASAIPNPPPGSGNPVSDFGYLFSHIADISDVNISGYYTIIADNTGSPGHEVSGPVLKFNNVVDGRTPLEIRSIGGIIARLQDESLGNNSIDHTVQLRRKSSGVGQAAAGLGTGIQVFITDTGDNDVEAGNLQFVTSNVGIATMSSQFILRTRLAGVNTQILNTDVSGNLLSAKKILATLGLGAGNRVARTTLATPGTITGQLEVFDMAGASLGSIAIHANGSFS